ncbi:aldehyde dehydrogenase family protein [Altererythrobacter aurantiacus]|uniref:2,5-dioxovalerate dehydrogenase n=1 Tax=Parapontixanthobacter aurantiacus TaxID=1463599 RepID=A0A844ZF02_9SPHN|nr:aldehyde dehydrogenase (NADP(+)) [Parapontixanthobacter aurantiacus]MXO85863.1 aldehyde dehydrogenase family protein [Parapontixanthobacter aurantiacus]
MLTGKNLIAGEWRDGNASFEAVDAASGEPLAPEFAEATKQDVADACSAAAEAQNKFGALSQAERAKFLRLAADKIDALGEALTERAMSESGLPQARLTGERGRTVGQLRLFADEVEEGAWQSLRIDHADPERTPPKPDLRLRKIPLGPVAVFGASNFPLAFSVAGGDTASALAAGCCVVVKGHPAHPGTSEMVAGAISEAVSECGLPAGVFSMLSGTGYDLGEALVKDPHIAAVGFTGSRSGGLALIEHAANREVPIPVYAEMSSINPVVLMPARLQEGAKDLAAAYVASLSLGAGQFCTNPGLVFCVDGDAASQFVEATRDALPDVAGQTMLTKGIQSAYSKGIAALGRLTGVELVGVGAEGSSACGQAHVYTVTGEDFRKDKGFQEEFFGPSSIIVRCADLDEVANILASLEGQLTATLHMSEADHTEAAKLVPVLEQIAGRIIANSWPTGVDVTHAMVHGGPFPATSDGRSTSVGTLAIERFLRPVSYQDMPESLLPTPLKNDNPGCLIRVNGKHRV